MFNLIGKEDYKKLFNFFKGLYKPKEMSILRYVNIFTIDDLTQEYMLFRIEGKNYKTPHQFYCYKLRNAYSQKKDTEETFLSRLTTSDSSEFDGDIKEIVIQNIDCKFSLSKSSKTDDEKTLDLCIINLGEFLKGFSYHIEKVLSHNGLTENERYYLKLAIDDLIKDSLNQFNFTESELLNIASETLRKNNVTELFDLEKRIQYLEDNYSEFLTEESIFLLKVLKSILNRDKTQYLMHPATKEEVGDLKQLSESIINDLTKTEIFKMTFLHKCLLAGKTQQEIKLINLLNENVAVMLSYNELLKLSEKHLNRFKPEDLYKLSYKDLQDMLKIPLDKILEYDNYDEEINKVI